MLNKDYAGTTAGIIRSTFPNITAPKRVDMISLLERVGNDYQAGLQKRADNELTEKMIAEHPEDKERIQQMGGNAYVNMLDANAQRAEERQWKLDDQEAQRQFQREMQDRAFANSRMLAEIGKASGGEPAPSISSNPFDKKRVEKVASEMDANIAKAEEMKSVFEQANNALKNINTGGILAKLTKNKPLLSSADEQMFDSAAAKSIDMVRKAGSGVMTDADAQRYEKATIDRSKDKATNQQLIDSGLIAANNAIAKEELRADWVRNGGDLGSFDREWRNYLNSNPIFTSNGKINANRQDAYGWFYNPESRTYKAPESAPETQAQKMRTIFGQTAPNSFNNMSDDDLLKGL